MTQELPFYIVDVFAEAKYTGNQLAVVRGGAGLTTEQMQRIAKEMNYSETTFILSDEERDGGYDVRIFTASEELPFAGHPTLGTAYVLQREIVKTSFEQIVLNLKVGQIPVTFTYKDGQPDVLWLRTQPPSYGQTADVAQVAAALNLNADDIDTRYPAQVVSVGVPFLIVPLKTLDAVQRARVDVERYLAAAQAADARWMLFFAPQTYHAENDLNARMIAVSNRVPWEDPATGSANGCLAAYLAHHRYFGSDSINTRVEQGYEIGRPSLLLLRTKPQGDTFNVYVGGSVFMVAVGTLV